MKTVLQDLIEEINKIRSQESDVLSEESSYHPKDVRQARLVFNTCQTVINKVRDMLPMEEKQIVDYASKMQMIKDVDFDGNVEFCFDPKKSFSQMFNGVA
jgi:hypothetical protein